MPNKDTPYQTLGEFLHSPFGNRDLSNNLEYDRKYREFVGKKLIYCENYTVIDGMYMIHIKIPSESQQGNFYDVVIQFFTDDPEIEKQLNLGRYYIQFFSNSPSFIYKYAALYKVHGYLIDAMYDKMDSEYSNMLPDKANPDYKMSYDKSIYFACKFLDENKFTILRKTGISLYKKVNMQKFLKSIKDYEMVKADSELYNLEQGIKKETEKEKLKAKEQRKEALNKLNPFSHSSSGSRQPKKHARTNTVKDGEPHGVHVTQKRKPVRNTSTSVDETGKRNQSIKVVKKKRAGTSTKKK